MHVEKLKDLEKRVLDLELRNQKVEKSKAWETSLTRKGLILLFTYLAISLYMKYVLNITPWINAIVPALGFMLSTQTLPIIKKIWKKYLYKV